MNATGFDSLGGVEEWLGHKPFNGALVPLYGCEWNKMAHDVTRIEQERKQLGWKNRSIYVTTDAPNYLPTLSH